MRRKFPYKNLSYLIHTCIATSMTVPAISNAQNSPDPEIEEVVVTGSYIRNSAFAQDANVNTISQSDLLESGQPSMASYVRDLSFTQNTNTVSNGLSGEDGGQNGRGARFNLRGLGENSTLQLVDGARSIDQSINSMLPDIAIERLEVVLDGGSALYGSDAVAGVVNFVPIKEYEGFRSRLYYQTDEQSDFEDMKASFLWGRSFDSGISYVGAFDITKATPLMIVDRPTLTAKDAGTSSSSNPGSWRRINNARPGVNVMQKHRGTPVGAVIVDPSCGTFNEGYPAHNQGYQNTPSGVRVNSTTCQFDFSKQLQLNNEQVNYTLFNTLTWEAADWLSFNLSNNYAYRVSDTRFTTVTGNATNNREVYLMRADHPANPWGFDVAPWNYRAVASAFTHKPDFVEGSTGAREWEYHMMNTNTKLRADYELSGSWSGYSYYLTSDNKNTQDDHELNIPKFQLALAGKGGPNGNEYWNPLGSADPRSPYYVKGVTSNSKAMTDWIFDSNNNVLKDRTSLDIFETGVQGELFKLPAGPVQMATGYQWRDNMLSTYPTPLVAAGQSNAVVLGSQIDTPKVYPSETRAVYLELEVPVLENVDAQFAVRHEEFTDFGLEATTPKVALRWEPLSSLALRVSWGESFLAPTAVQARPFVADENCAEVFSGNDPFISRSLLGSSSCTSGNPDMRPELSTIKNIGFTWQPEGTLSGLELSVDYQQIDYIDRIRLLSNQDTVGGDFETMLRDTGIARSAYNATPGSANRIAAEAWYAQHVASGQSKIERYPDFSVKRIFRQSTNISSIWIDLFDVKLSYSFDTNDWGNFRTELQSSIFDKYEYQDLFGGVKSALGMQNADTSITPPLPKIKANMSINWNLGSHRASVSSSYWHDIEFDSFVSDFYNDGWTAPKGNKINAETLVNARYGYIFNDFFGGGEVVASVGVNNLFDRSPQRLPIPGGFETRLSSPWGRQYSITLEWAPGS